MGCGKGEGTPMTHAGGYRKKGVNPGYLIGTWSMVPLMHGLGNEGIVERCSNEQMSI